MLRFADRDEAELGNPGIGIDHDAVRCGQPGAQLFGKGDSVAHRSAARICGFEKLDMRAILEQFGGFAVGNEDDPSARKASAHGPEYRADNLDIGAQSDARKDVNRLQARRYPGACEGLGCDPGPHELRVDARVRCIERVRERLNEAAEEFTGAVFAQLLYELKARLFPAANAIEKLRRAVAT